MQMQIHTHNCRIKWMNQEEVFNREKILSRKSKTIKKELSIISNIFLLQNKIYDRKVSYNSYYAIWKEVVRGGVKHKWSETVMWKVIV